MGEIGMPRDRNNFQDSFDFDAARNYWKHAPSGKGKCDTAELMELDDQAFFSQWNSHFKSRLTHYWEDRLMVEHFATLFKNKRILSFGSGIGHNEVQFLEQGAEVVCADIVQSNLDVIDRVCRIKKIKGCTTLFMEDSANTDFGKPYDYIYVRGSLMTMPENLQVKALANFYKALKPNGMIILNLYTWEFVRQTCGVDDPIEFAKASDPSVGSLNNPWSDWHDDEKLQRLAGSNLYILHRQFWNQNQYVWYALSPVSVTREKAAVSEFVDLNALENFLYSLVYDVKISTMKAYESTILKQADTISVQTKSNKCLYAVGTKKLKLKKLGIVDKFSLDLELIDGLISVGVVDIKEQRMVFTSIISNKGRHVHHFRLPEDVLPDDFEIIISNHQPNAEAVSRFVVHHLKLWKEMEK